MSRSVPEWIGKTPDDKVPARVRLRIFNAHNKTCHISGLPIHPGDQWDLEHIKALFLGGEHRESNLAPALRDKHRKKTATEMAVKAKIDRVAKKHAGIRKATAKIASRGFAKIKKDRKRPKRPAVSPRPLYR